MLEIICFGSVLCPPDPLIWWLHLLGPSGWQYSPLSPGWQFCSTETGRDILILWACALCSCCSICNPANLCITFRIILPLSRRVMLCGHIALLSYSMPLISCLETSSANYPISFLTNSTLHKTLVHKSVKFFITKITSHLCLIICCSFPFEASLEASSLFLPTICSKLSCLFLTWTSKFFQP